MSAREILAYAVTHAPKGVKGGPYEAGLAIGEQAPALRDATRWTCGRLPLPETLRAIRKVHPTARVIRIVRKARPSEAEDATKAERVANSERLRIVGKNMCGLLMDMRVATRDDIAERVTFALREINSFLSADSKVSVPEVDPSPSEASAVAVLRELVAYDNVGFAYDSEPGGKRFGAIVDRARVVLAASGPDPAAVVRAAMVDGWTFDDEKPVSAQRDGVAVLAGVAEVFVERHCGRVVTIPRAVVEELLRRSSAGEVKP